MRLVTPLGVGVEQNWEALCKGRSGIRKIDRFEVSDLASQIAGLVSNFDPEQFMERKDVRRNDPFVHFGMAASELAAAAAGSFVQDGNADRVAVMFGTGFGGLQTCEDAYHVLEKKGPGRMSPFYVPMIIPNLAPGQIAIRFGAKGPNLCFSTACSASTHSVGQGFRMIRGGEADVVIAGGAEAAVTRLGVSAFAAMRALSRRNDEPEKASRPFERDRDGFVIGEGAGVLILEEHGYAVKRGAYIFGEIIGYGQNADAHHITAPSPEGEGAAECMRAALRDARIKPGRGLCERPWHRNRLQRRGGDAGHEGGLRIACGRPGHQFHQIDDRASPRGRRGCGGNLHDSCFVSRSAPANDQLRSSRFRM